MYFIDENSIEIFFASANTKDEKKIATSKIHVLTYKYIETKTKI